MFPPYSWWDAVCLAMFGVGVSAFNCRPEKTGRSVNKFAQLLKFLVQEGFFDVIKHSFEFFLFVEEGNPPI